MLSKNGEKFLFSHLTFREFYAADFIRRLLTKQGLKFDEDLCNYLIIFLTDPAFVVVRMFLNEALDWKITYEKIEAKIPKIAKNFSSKVEKFNNVSNIFEENLTNLIDFLFEVFKFGSYNKICKILNKNSSIVLSSTKNEELFIKVTNFIINYLKSTDLRKFITDSQVLISIFATPLDVKVIDDFIKNIEDKTDSKFICDSLQARKSNGENLMFILIQSEIHQGH